MVQSDRPLSRKLIRLGFQFGGPTYAHRQDIWPGLSIDRDAGVAVWKGGKALDLTLPSALIARNLNKIAVVGSGPSLKGQDIAALGDGSAILCNGAALLVDRLKPLAVAVEDERFIFRHHQMLADLPHDTPLLLSPAALRAWAERHIGSLSSHPIALLDNLAKPVGGPRRGLADPDLEGVVVHREGSFLSMAPDKGVVITGTVAFSGLQVALAAHPSRITLAGIDLKNGREPRFYEAGDTAPSGLVDGLKRILGGFELALTVATEQGISLECASPVSALLDVGYPYSAILDRPIPRTSDYPMGGAT